MQRYARQTVLPFVGEQGQRDLLAARVTLIGCGALGSVLADTLVRAGVGHIRICDRDIVERHNLQRQSLFDEADAEAGLPKVEAAAARLHRINSDVQIDAAATDVDHRNIERLIADADCILDGTDNFETRYLINDAAIAHNKPWVYGAVLAAEGLVLPVLPGETRCLRCFFDEPPTAEETPTCETAGVLGSAVKVVAALQATEALKILLRRREDVARCLTTIDLWRNRFAQVSSERNATANTCPCCGRRDFPFLRGERTRSAQALCGRKAVQVQPPADAERMNLEALAERLQKLPNAAVRRTRFMLAFAQEGFEFSVFPDGRAIIKGTEDPNQARSLYARYVGA